MNPLRVTSPAFEEGGYIPLDHTGRGKDLSPRLNLEGLDEGARSLAVTLDDDSHPLFPRYNHWLIWKLPVCGEIPAGIPHGKTVPSLASAVQGVAYGRHRYRGPKPPFRWNHRYTFTVYVLDCLLTLPPDSRRRDFFEAIDGHLLQRGTLTGQFQSCRDE